MNNMKKYAGAFIIILIFSLLPLAGTQLCQANSAEPPSIIIIVPDAPDDMEIGVGGLNRAIRVDRAFESYFSFYSYQLKYIDYTLTVYTGDSSYEIRMDFPLEKYNNTFTLDWKNRTLTPGQSAARDIIFLLLRIVITLVIEAVLFLALGYRKKKSWIVFLAVNLITQAGLYIWLNTVTTPFENGYLIFTLLLGEVIILVVELITFLILVNERHRLLTAFYVIAANILSLVAGWLLLTNLPL